MFFPSFTTSASIAVSTAPKSVSEKLVGFFEALKPDTAYGTQSSRRTPPTFHGTLCRDPFAPTPGQEFYHTAFYGNSSTPVKKRTSPPSTKRVSTASQHPSPRVAPSNVPSKQLHSRSSPTSGKTASTADASPTMNIEDYKRAAIRCCSASFGKVKISDVGSGIPDDHKNNNRRFVQDFAQRVLKDKLHSKWFPRQHSPITREMVAAVGKVAVLPYLERFSTSNGLYGASLLGNGVRSNNMSYGRPRGVPRIVKHVMAVPAVVKREQFVIPMMRPTSRPRAILPVAAHYLGKCVNRSSSVKPNAVKFAQKPKWVVRNGCEEWGRKVEDIFINQHIGQCDRRGRPIRSPRSI